MSENYSTDHLSAAQMDIARKIQAQSAGPAMPTFCFEERRYDQGDDPESQPEGWVFVTLTPEHKPFYGSEDPFDMLKTDEAVQAYGTDPSLVQYESKLEGWMRAPLAEEIRIRLAFDGFRRVSWDEVPERVFAYLRHCQAPIEWQSNPEKIKGRSWIWLKGEWPPFSRINEVAFGDFEV